MLVVMRSHATDAEVRAVCERIETLGYKAHPIPGAGRTAIGITGNSGAVDIGSLESMPGVVECIPVSKPYKLVSRDVKLENTVVRIPTPLGDVLFGGADVAMVGGPCAIETREQAFTVAKHVKAAGARLFSRRSLQAADFPLQLSRARGIRTANHGGSSQGIRLGDYHGGD